MIENDDEHEEHLSLEKNETAFKGCRLRVG